MEDVLYKYVEVQAEENCRSFSGQLEYMIKQEIKRLSDEDREELQRFEVNIVD